MSYRISVALVVAAGLGLVGCTKNSAPSVPAIPNTPEGTVQAVAKSLSQKQPGVIWEALPGSYQKDVSGLLKTFGEKMDKEVYDKIFTVAGKLTKVLQNKKDFILNHPMLQQGQVKVEEAKKNWDAVVGIFDTIVSSEIKTLASLKSLDVGKFLSTTGAQVMQKASEASKMDKNDELNHKLDELGKVKVEVVSSGDGVSKLKITATTDKGEETEEVEFVQVEGKWIPKDLADKWAEGMAEARKSLEEMKMGENKAQAIMMLGGIESALDGLAGAKTQEEFNQLAGQAMGQIMGGIMGGMGAGGGGMQMPPPGK